MSFYIELYNQMILMQQDLMDEDPDHICIRGMLSQERQLQPGADHVSFRSLSIARSSASEADKPSLDPDPDDCPPVAI